jgi:hypothetical protein
MNVTIVLEDAVARWVRVKAAEDGTSVSRWVGQLLGERMREEGRYAEAMADFFAVRRRRLKRSGRYPSREEIHDRPRLRRLR